MRLLKCNNDGKFILTEFLSNNIPKKYAILSHTWEEEEVTFEDLQDGTGTKKAGYNKIRFCGEQARRNNLEYFWVDTCCIDKSSSAELSEAINSMFQWYKEATICYAYLSNLSTSEPTASELGNSRRGWTLQELIAPRHIRFYSRQWEEIRTNWKFTSIISEITGINSKFLTGYPLSHASIAERMSWASNRTTTSAEDVAYCLLGIFDVQMPLLYGEGGVHAFLRLQEELLRKYDDQSLFAWNLVDWKAPSTYRNALAPSPKCFQNCGDVVCCEFGHSIYHSTITNVGILIKLPLIEDLGGFATLRTNSARAILKCRRRGDFSNAIAIHLCRSSNWVYRRDSWPQKLINQSSTDWKKARIKLIYLATTSGSTPEPTWANPITNAFHVEHLPKGYRICAIHPPDRQIDDQDLSLVRSITNTKTSGRETILMLIQSIYEDHQSPLLLILTVIKSNLHKKILRCFIAKAPDGVASSSLPDLMAELDYSALQDAIYSNGGLLTISVQPRTQFTNLLLVVRVEESAPGPRRVVTVVYRYLRWAFLRSASTDVLLAVLCLSFVHSWFDDVYLFQGTELGKGLILRIMIFTGVWVGMLWLPTATPSYIY